MAYIGNGPGVASQRITTSLTATSNQTTFTPTSGYTVGYVDVYLNGVRLVNGTDYTASNGTTVVLASGAAENDVLEVVAYLPRGLSDGYTKAEADARYLGIDAETLPSQTGQSGKYLTTDGTDASWDTIDALPSQSGESGKYLTTNGTTASWGTVDTSAAGSDTQIQYNNAGARAGAAGLTTDGSNLTIKTQGDLRFGDADDSNYVGFQAPATVAANKIWTLPGADGTNGQVLSTNGSGTLSWSSGAAPGPFADGSVGSPSITFSADTNTGFYRPTTDTLAVVTNGTQRMRFDDVGRVGIGTNAGTSLNEKGRFYYTTQAANFFKANEAQWANGNLSVGYYFDNGTNYPNETTSDYATNIFSFGYFNNRGSARTHGTHFTPRGSAIWAVAEGINGDQGTAAIRADCTPYYGNSYGVLVRNRYSPTSGYGVCFMADMEGHIFGGGQTGLYVRTIASGNESSGNVGIRLHDETTSATRSAVIFSRGGSGTNSFGTTVGTITYSSSATAYNTSSDYRLKENIVDLDDGISYVMQMRPVSFDWKSGGSSVGFIAHELQAIVPDAVSGEKDAYERKPILNENGDPILDAEGNPQTEPDLEKPLYQGVDSSFLVPHLVKAVQQLSAKCDALEARIAALENQP